MKYVSTKNGYISLNYSITRGGAVNLLNEPDEQHPPPQPIKTNSSVGIVREPDPLVRGGDLISSLQKINFSKNTSKNKRKNIVFAV